ncbi:MAG TPA: DUF4209 domain-containing protein [Candidatus Saccharimonadales bacterium]
MKEDVKAFLSDLEGQEFFDILRKSLELKKLIYTEETTATQPEELAELYAFSFFPQHEKNETSYTYGPQWVLPDDEGNMREFPSRSLVTEEMQDYWFKRLGETNSSVLKSRYADLIYDFTDRDKDPKGKFSAALEVIKANFEIANITEKGKFREYTSRALHLIQLTNNADYRAKFIDLLVERSAKVEEYSGYVFSNLVTDKKWRRYLSDTQLQTIVSNLDKYLSATLPSKKAQPWAVDELATSLAKYYAEQDDEASVARITGLLEKNFRDSEYANSSGMLKSNYLETLRTMYEEFAQFEFARTKRDTITNELTSIADEVEASMQEFKFSAEIPKEQQEQLQEFIKWIFEDNGKPTTLDLVIQKIVVNFLPKLDDEKSSFETMRKENPIGYLFTTTIVGEDGFNIAKLNGYDEDPDKYFVKHYSENLHFNGIILRMVLHELKARFGADEMRQVLMKSPLFRKEDENYIDRALKGFWEKDYLVSSHLFIPLVEDGFRILHRINGLPIITPNEDGGFDFYNNLERYIDHDVVSGVFGSLGDNFRYYAKILLVTRMGWNLRHNFAHGINKSSLLRPDASERLLHVLFCLSLVRLPEAKKEKQAE